MNIKRWARLFLVIAITTSTYPVHALGHLTVEMRSAYRAPVATTPFQTGEIELILKNTGDRLIEVVMEDLPYTVPKTGTTRPMFLVSSDGQEAKFTGRMINFSDKDVTTVSIAPG